MPVCNLFMKVRSGSQTHMYSKLIVAHVVLNVVRMIKLFGWERRVTDQVEERREAELKILRKTKFLELTNNLIK